MTRNAYKLSRAVGVPGQAREAASEMFPQPGAASFLCCTTRRHRALRNEDRCSVAVQTEGEGPAPPLSRCHIDTTAPPPRSTATHQTRVVRLRTFVTEFSPNFSKAAGVSGRTWWQAAQSKIRSDDRRQRCSGLRYASAARTGAPSVAQKNSAARNIPACDRPAVGNGATVRNTGSRRAAPQ